MDAAHFHNEQLPQPPSTRQFMQHPPATSQIVYGRWQAFAAGWFHGPTSGQPAASEHGACSMHGSLHSSSIELPISSAYALPAIQSLVYHPYAPLTPYKAPGPVPTAGSLNWTAQQGRHTLSPVTASSTRDPDELRTMGDWCIIRTRSAPLQALRNRERLFSAIKSKKRELPANGDAQFNKFVRRIAEKLWGPASESQAETRRYGSTPSSSFELYTAPSFPAGRSASCFNQRRSQISTTHALDKAHFCLGKGTGAVQAVGPHRSRIHNYDGIPRSSLCAKLQQGVCDGEIDTGWHRSGHSNRSFYPVRDNYTAPTGTIPVVLP
ncbi:hypothetical protein QBC40DRAFT_318108 [Triangularia verruculosa]|uniref:Uncharacterized protein n=1 Tax=Triangularia verruculosa TaxID=2587418 RepID=A0AAN6XBQ5_9PEZI|nr:hypothetical protein QBC40DRAFT_318108 [Triangularia verruculosa]